MNYSKHDLQQLETIEQAWDGDELKIEDDEVRVWLVHRENRQYNGDYVIETLINGRWEQQSYMFDQAGYNTYIHITIKLKRMKQIIGLVLSLVWFTLFILGAGEPTTEYEVTSPEWVGWILVIAILGIPFIVINLLNNNTIKNKQ